MKKKAFLVSLSFIFLNYLMDLQAIAGGALFKRNPQLNNIYKCSKDLTERYWSYGNSHGSEDYLSLYCGNSKNAQWVLLGGYIVYAHYEFSGNNGYQVKKADLEFAYKVGKISKRKNYYYLPKAVIGFDCNLSNQGWVCERYSETYKNLTLTTQGKYNLVSDSESDYKSDEDIEDFSIYWRFKNLKNSQYLYIFCDDQSHGYQRYSCG